MPYLFYVAVKLIAYIGWCWLGLWLWRIPARFPKAAGFGIMRLAIGVVFGVTIFFVVPTQQEDLLWKYIVIYAPVRLVEWVILALIIRRKPDRRTTFSLFAWCAGGILVSFIADFASPEGVAGHFCVGRCLC
jgi:hypothetical protein